MNAMKPKRWYRLHELMRWDEGEIFRAREAAAMRGHHSSEEWQRILSAFRPAPGPVPVTVAIDGERIALTPVTPADQLQLSAIVARLSNLVVSNAVDAFDPRLPFRLRPLVGLDAFTAPNCWRRRTYRVPIVFARANQRCPAAWPALCEALAAEPGRVWSVDEIANEAMRDIAATLSGSDADDFWRANR